MLRAGLFNFSKGELGEKLHGRVDVAAYSAAARLARNVTVLKYGGLARRMGTRLAYELREPDSGDPDVSGWDIPEATAKLVPFEFSIEQTYALLMTQAEMRPLAFGGAVLEDHLEILAITAAANAVITANFHAYSVGDEVFLTGIDGAMGDYLNGRAWLVTAVPNGNQFAIDANTTGLVFTGATGGTTRVGAPPAPPAPPVVPPPYAPPPPPEVIPPGNWGRDGREGRNFGNPIP